MRALTTALLLALLGGCSEPQPTLTGGKPAGHWVEQLSANPDAKVRKEAAFKLGNVGPADPAALPALTAALKDRDAAVRREAVLALVKFGPSARPVVPALVDLRDRDRDPKVRGYAAKAVEKLQASE